MDKERLLGELVKIHESKVKFQPHDLMSLQNIINHLDPLVSDPQRVRDYFFQKIFDSPEEAVRLTAKLLKIEQLLIGLAKAMSKERPLFQEIVQQALALNKRRQKILTSAIEDYEAIKIKW